MPIYCCSTYIMKKKTTAENACIVLLLMKMKKKRVIQYDLGRERERLPAVDPIFSFSALTAKFGPSLDFFKYFHFNFPLNATYTALL